MAPRRVVNVSHTKTKTKKNNEIKKQKELIIKEKTEEIISSMAPVDLVSRESPDGRYIKITLIKAKDIPIIPSRQGKEKKVKENKHKEKGVEKERVQTTRREKQNEKEKQPITGPFECLHPSASAGGTCQKTFSSCCEYSAHVREKHPRWRKARSCQVCEKPLVTRGDCSYSCKVCGVGFNSGRALLYHKKSHEKPAFVCSICDKQSTDKSNMEAHMRSHTGDRPFKCKYCKKTFTQRSSLNRHLRIHTKVKPYRCVVCSKMFSQSGHLQYHMRTHTQMSPFQCVHCQKRFKQPVHLKNHLETHITVSQMSNEGQTVVPGDANTSITEVSNEQLVEGEGGDLDTGEEYDQGETIEDKAKDIPIIPSRQRKEKKVKEKIYKENKHKEKGVEKERVQTTRREKQNEKEIQPITGPFECLEPSASAGGACQQTFSSCCEYSAHVSYEHARRRKWLSCQVCEKPLAANRARSCEVCGAGFDSGEALSKHQKAHEKQPFVCDICYKQFTQKSNLERHMRIHTGNRPFKCKYCKKAFIRKSNLKYHVLNIHTKEKPHRCVVCSKMFSQSAHLRRHMRTHTQVSPFQCVLCQKRFKESSHLKSHLKTHITISQMSSNECQTADSSMAQRRVISIIPHTKTKAEDTPEGASIPSRKRKTEKEKAQTSQRKKEKEIQPITGPFECLHPSAVAGGACGQTFSSCCEYSAHVGDEHARRLPRTRCQVCEKPLAGDYSCEVCDAGFYSGEALLKHQEAHEKQPFVCDICYKQFTYKCNMEAHMRLHTGDRPFKCKHCKKSFTGKSNLNKHVRIHTKEKPYRCVVCSKMFSQSETLRRHMRTHTQVAPFQCVLCQKRFKQSSTLKRHLKIHVTVSQMCSNEEPTVVPGDANTSITEVSNEH